MLATLTRLGISSDVTPSQLRAAREHFEQHNYLRMRGFIDPSLFRVIQRYLRGAVFERQFWNSGHDLTISNSPLADVVHVLMNDPKLLRLVGQATGCGPIASFKGRIYRMVARKGLRFDWHPDIKNDRKAAISVNLSDAEYGGGTLEIRDNSSGVREVVPNLGPGDAVIFRVAEHLEHRVTRVTGKVPKTAIAGFFCSRPRYRSVHRELVARSESAIAAGAGRKKRLAFPSPNDVVKISAAVISQTARRETFVANVATAMCYGLNQTGGRIWELFAEGLAMRSVADTIARENGAPRRDVERDVLALARQLAQRDLIKVVRAQLD